MTSLVSDLAVKVGNLRKNTPESELRPLIDLLKEIGIYQRLRTNKFVSHELIKSLARDFKYDAQHINTYLPQEQVDSCLVIILSGKMLVTVPNPEFEKS